MRDQRAELNPGWKGEQASYNAVHKWRQRNRPKTGNCQDCRTEARTVWANISGECRRDDDSDWRELCYSCHQRMDLRLGRAKPPPIKRARPLCRNGHSDWYVNPRGVRYCRSCKNQHERAARAARRDDA